MSTVFRNYDQSGEVNKNAHPVVDTYPWILQRNDFATLVQPHEKGTFFTPGKGASIPKPTSCLPCGVKESQDTSLEDGRRRG